jgi:hypothetical protein
MESKETKLVWITMLAMSNRFGFVDSSVPGLAKMAGVKRAECEDAIAVLSSPDSFSRTKDHDGRRIKPSDGDSGGWYILNHAKYRAKMNEDERREYNRLKQQEYRASLKPVSTESANVSNGQTMSAPSAHSESESESDTDSKADAEPDRQRRGVGEPLLGEWLAAAKDMHPDWPPADAEAAWNHYEARGWKSGKSTISRWKSCINTCYTNFKNGGLNHGTHKSGTDGRNGRGFESRNDYSALG